MIRYTESVSDTFTNVTLPVTKQIVHKIINDLGAKSLFKSEIYFKSNNTGAYASSDSEHNAKLTENRVNVNIKQNLNPLSLKWEATTFQHFQKGNNGTLVMYGHKPLLYDFETNTMVMERDMPFNITIDVELIVKDHVAIDELISRVYNMYSHGDMIEVQNLQYVYAVPQKIYTSVYGVYKMTDKPPEDFIKYLYDITDGRITLSSNRHDLDGAQQLVVRRNIDSALITIEFNADDSDTEGEGSSTDTYKVAFTLTTQFGRPNNVEVAYPIIVHNKTVANELVDYAIDPDEAWLTLSRTHPWFNYANFRQSILSKTDVDFGCIIVPWYDEYIVKGGSAVDAMYYKPFYQIALTLDDIDNPNGVTEVDLVDGLPNRLIDPILDSMRLSKSKLLEFGEQFHVGFYVNETLIEPAQLTLTDDLVLTLPYREIYPVYRLIISEYIGKPYGTLNQFRVGQFDIVARYQSTSNNTNR